MPPDGFFGNQTLQNLMAGTPTDPTVGAYDAPLDLLVSRGGPHPFNAFSIKTCVCPYFFL